MIFFLYMFIVKVLFFNKNNKYKMSNDYKSVGDALLEQDVHSKISKQCKMCIVELGILNGDTTKIFLENSNVRVYGIDPIIPDSMNEKLIGDLNKILDLKKFSNFIFIQDYSFNVIKNWNESISYLFIDASHLYSDVERDFNDWFPFLINGGYISFHDSAANRGGPYWWDGPSKFVDEIIMNDDRLEYVETVFSMTVFKKIK